MSREIHNLIAETMAEYRKMHVKRMHLLKTMYDEDDWELINTNTKYVSYFL